MGNKQEELINEAGNLADNAAKLSDDAVDLANKLLNVQLEADEAVVVSGVDPFIFALTVFVLACFVGYFVVWRVTPALHTPLMAVTNAISSIIIVGAIIAAGSVAMETVPSQLGLVALFLASVNIFGGFIVTQRMLQMFKKKRSASTGQSS